MDSFARMLRAAGLLAVGSLAALGAGCGASGQPSSGPVAPGPPPATQSRTRVADPGLLPALLSMPSRPAGRTHVGDIAGTGQPEVGSAIKILRVVVGLDPAPSDITLWDCNRNGQIDTGDAIKVLRWVVGADPWVTVAVSPVSATVAAGQTQTFATQVTGSSNTDVIWSVQEDGGGTVSAGVYTAPATPGTYHVVVTSKADPTQAATATVQVLAATGDLEVTIQ